MMYIEHRKSLEFKVIDDSGSLAEVMAWSHKLRGPVCSWFDLNMVEGDRPKTGDVIQLLEREERWTDKRHLRWVRIKEA